ncbi:unnamed protein product [Amoebophrya sp. A25]|nr:unnamed protein product [Amoebophrya sp. A25]|eukprot:GSA25T00016650001.1
MSLESEVATSASSVIEPIAPGRGSVQQRPSQRSRAAGSKREKPTEEDDKAGAEDADSGGGYSTWFGWGATEEPKEPPHVTQLKKRRERYCGILWALLIPVITVVVVVFSLIGIFLVVRKNTPEQSPAPRTAGGGGMAGGAAPSAGAPTGGAPAAPAADPAGPAGEGPAQPGVSFLHSAPIRPLAEASIESTSEDAPQQVGIPLDSMAQRMRDLRPRAVSVSASATLTPEDEDTSYFDMSD